MYRQFAEALEWECAAVSRSDSPEITPRDEVDALVYKRLTMDDSEGLIDTASTTLKVKASAEPDKLTIGNSPEMISVGNIRGPGLLERFIQMEASRGPQTRVTDLEDIARHKATAARHKTIIARLEGEVAKLKEATADYGIRRERSLAGFKRDVLDKSTRIREDLSLISAANALVLSGGLVFDKRFCLGAGHRTDDATFTAFYGLSPVAARRLGVFNFYRTTSFRTDGCS